MEYEFKSLQELYNRITPALRSKCSEFYKFGYKEIKESDIWNYLTDNKWKSALELTLSDMVDDIFKVRAEDITNYMIKKVSDNMREPNLENTELLDI